MSKKKKALPERRQQHLSEQWLNTDTLPIGRSEGKGCAKGCPVATEWFRLIGENFPNLTSTSCHFYDLMCSG